MCQKADQTNLCISTKVSRLKKRKENRRGKKRNIKLEFSSGRLPARSGSLTSCGHDTQSCPDWHICHNLRTYLARSTDKKSSSNRVVNAERFVTELIHVKIAIFNLTSTFWLRCPDSKLCTGVR